MALSLGLALYTDGSVAAQRRIPSGAALKQVPHDPAVEYYVLSAKVSDAVEVCVPVPQDEHVACVSVKTIRSTYQARHWIK